MTLKLDGLSPAMVRVLRDVLSELTPNRVRLTQHRRRRRQRKERRAIAAALLNHAWFLVDRAEGTAERAHQVQWDAARSRKARTGMGPQEHIDPVTYS